MKRRAWILAGCVWVSGGRARADDGHYQNFVLGERAAGMGGAYTAIADDPSGTYYNPAGLVGAQADVLNASLSVYGFQQQSLHNALHVPAENLFQNVRNSIGAAFQQLNTVPAMAGTVYGLGDRDSVGHFRQLLSLSVLVPDATSASAINYVVDSSGNLQSLAQTTFDQTALLGLGYALRVSDEWSLGVSLNGLYRSLTRNARSVTAQGAASGPSTSFFIDDLSLQLTVVGLYVQAGILWHPSPELSVGLTIACPSMTLFSNASTDEVQAGAAGLTETLQQGLNGDTRWPGHGRLGAAYEFRGLGLLLAADLSLWGAAGYQLVAGATDGARLPNFVNDVQRNVTWNLNLGAQYALFERFPLRAGFFTNNSSAPGLTSTPEPQLDNVNLYGVTLGFSIPGQATESTFGVTFSFGQGQSKTPTSNVTGTGLVYAAGATDQLFLDAFLGGSYQF